MKADQIKWKSFWFTRQNFQLFPNVPLSNINVDRYIYNERSYRDLKRLEKILYDAKSLQPQSFTTNNRTKRCVPSDSRISPSVSAPSKSLPHAMDQGRTFCFGVIISATIFARRKSAGGNMIGLNHQRKSHASSRSFGGWGRAHFPEQRLVIAPIKMAAKKTSIFNRDTSHIFKSLSGQRVQLSLLDPLRSGSFAIEKSTLNENSILMTWINNCLHN